MAIYAYIYIYIICLYAFPYMYIYMHTYIFVCIDRKGVLELLGFEAMNAPVQVRFSIKGCRDSLSPMAPKRGADSALEGKGKKSRGKEPEGLVAQANALISSASGIEKLQVIENVIQPLNAIFAEWSTSGMPCSPHGGFAAFSASEYRKCMTRDGSYQCTVHFMQVALARASLDSAR